MKASMGSQPPSCVQIGLLLALLSVLFCTVMALAASPPDIEWIRTYGNPAAGFNEYGHSVEQTRDGGFVIAGSIPNGADRDAYLIKTDADGHVVWEAAIDTGHREDAVSVCQTADGGYAAVGTWSAPPGGGVSAAWLFKTDNSGDLLWDVDFGNSEPQIANHISVTQAGGFIIAARTGRFGAGDADAWLIETDANGNVIWQNTYGTAEANEVANCVQQTADGGYIMVGERGDGVEMDALLIKTDSQGAVSWERSFGGPLGDSGIYVSETGDGGFAIAGQTDYDLCDADMWDSKAWLLKVDEAGNKEWERSFGSDGYFESASFVQQAPDGGYVVIGGRVEGEQPCTLDAADIHFWFLKTDWDGNLMWERSVDIPRVGWGAQHGAVTADGGLVGVGTSADMNELDADVALVKLAPGRPPDTEIISCDVAGASASIAWTGTDDTTSATALRYSYRLVRPGPAYDAWSTWSSGKTKTYTALSPGSYTFQVRAKDGDGAIDPSPASHEFVVWEPGKVPVIIIPGIMGSELFKIRTLPDLRLWPDVACPHMFTDVNDLKLGASGQNLPGVSVYVGDVIRNYPTECLGWIADLFAPHYDDLIYYLVDAGYPENQDLFVFPYDWRKDIRLAAVELAWLVDDVLEGSGAEKVDIVAHSMGGLIARYYINSSSSVVASVFHESAEKIRKLVLLGTPSYGAPDAFQSLHPELGRGVGPFFSDSKAQELSSNYPAVYQLLPTVRFFELYTHIFNDRWGLSQPGPLVGVDPQATWSLTYLENTDSRLVDMNKHLLLDAPFSAYEFHRSLGDELRFGGETYIIAGSGTPTKLVFRKQTPEAYPHYSTPPSVIAAATWIAEPTNGDGTVPLRSVTELVTSGPLRVFHTTARHSNLPKHQAVKKLVLYILTGDSTPVPGIAEESSVRDGSSCDQAFALPNQSIVVIKSPVELQIYDSFGGYVGPHDSDVIRVLPGTDYFTLGDETVAFLPMTGTYDIEALATGHGTFGLEILETRDAVCSRTLFYEDVEVTPSSRAQLRYAPGSTDLPPLNVDSNGDGTTDIIIRPVEGNTPLDLSLPLAFFDGRVALALSRITSAGHTNCLSVDVVDGLDESFRPVTPFYLFTTTATPTGPIAVTIKYDEDAVPLERERGLRLYRINGNVEDITQQLDEATDSVSGETNGFSYFVVGYMNATPETSILAPEGDDTLTESPFAVRWQASDPDESDTALSLDLFYSSDGRASWTTLATDEDNDGVYSWDISNLLGGEYWLKVVATDPDGASAEAINGPFIISTFEGAIIIGPNPVTRDGTTFYCSLPEGTSTAELMVFNPVGSPVFETSLDVGSSRFPETGRWDPVNQDGIPLANGPYVYVLIADGRVIGQGKMVIQR